MHPLAEEYLHQLGTAAQGLPPQERDELLAEIRAHLQAGLPDAPGDADVRNLLDSLGRPEDIVAAARSESGGAPVADQPDWRPPPTVSPPPASPWGTLEILAVLGLTVGTFLLPVVGPAVGIVLAWVSERWTRREKPVATVLTVLPVIVLSLGLAMVVTTGSSSDPDPVPAPVVSEGAAQ
jgi:uncharacterized membrane protein